MSEQISLKEVENKLYRTTFQDGTLELFLSAFVLLFAVAPLLSPSLGDFWSSFVFLPFWALVWLVIRLIRTRVVLPRTGSVRFGSWRTRRLKQFTWIMVAFNLAALLLGVISFLSFERLGTWAIPLRFAAILLLGFSTAAALLGQLRFILYGLLLAAAPLAGEYLYQNYAAGHHGYPLTFGFSAAVLFFTGLCLLLRLVRAHPLEEEAHSRGGN